MVTRSQHLQIRVTPEEKQRLKRLAADAGVDVSAYVLARSLPAARARFEELVALLIEGEDHRYVFAGLNDLLGSLGAEQLRDAVASGDALALSPFLGNYVAAMVEQACDRAGVRPPEWTVRVPPLEAPWFAAPLKSLRLHLLQASPVPFKRRNLFVDAGVGARV